MPEDLCERLDALGTSVVAPLVLGGAVTPVRPIGARLALGFDIEFQPSDLDLWSRVGVARVRQARLLAPLDTLPSLTPAEWALAAAFNDLLQVSNEELSGVFTAGRHAELLSNVRVLLERIPPPADVLEAIARHATYARVFEVVRKDVTVSWWSGSQRFRGRTPNARLLAWPKLRGVKLSRELVGLCDMHRDVDDALPYARAWQAWIARTPLTDFATAARKQPEFAWSESTLSLISVPPGRTVALRALTRQPRQLVVSAIERATKALPTAEDRGPISVDGFAQDLSQAFDARA